MPITTSENLPFCVVTWPLTIFTADDDSTPLVAWTLFISDGVKLDMELKLDNELRLLIMLLELVLVITPGFSIIKPLPVAFIWPSTCDSIPFEIETILTTETIPIIIPRTVNRLLVLANLIVLIAK